MKKITMNDIAKITKNNNNTEINEHLDPIQLALLKDKKLSEKEEEAVFKHLLQCKRCKNVLEIANELEQQETPETKPVNNPDYKKIIKSFLPLAASVVFFIGVPMGDKYFTNESNMKSAISDTNILQESIQYWEDLFEKLFNGE